MKNVTIRVVSPRGHDVEVLEPTKALERLKSLQEDGKWLFMDGEKVNNVEDLTIDNILQAESIQATNQLIGG